MSIKKSIKILSAALDDGPNETTILRGVLSPESLIRLNVDDYQREVLSKKRVQEFQEALREGTVPNVDLGMRGDTFRVGGGETSDVVYLQDPVFIVDGLQRVTAAIGLIGAGGEPHLGASIHFNTKKEWERKRFEILNDRRTRVSPNVLIRNLREEIPVVEMIHNLCLDKSFPLYKAVCWEQRQKAGELINIRTLVKVALLIHRNFGAAGMNTPREMAVGLNKIMNKIGRQRMRDNIMIFFNVIDGCWSIRNITYKEYAAHIKLGFMTSLANVFSKHKRVYWSGDRLVVDKQTRQKLKAFPLADPHVKELTGKANDQGCQFLSTLIVEHINKGRRTHRLAV